MTDSRKDPAKASTPPDVGVVCDVGRRRWLQAGISAAPVVMTVASRPVLATVQAQSPSAMCSGNVSGQQTVSSSGSSPSTWSSQSSWPTYNKYSAKFKDFFSPDLYLHTDIKMKDVLKLTAPPGSNNEVAQYILAALLNHENHSVPDSILPLAVIHSMWADYQNGSGSYKVNASVYFNGGQLVTYIKTTIG
jgi:hypothetical protein